MEENNRKLELLFERINILSRRQWKLNQQIDQLNREAGLLRDEILKEEIETEPLINQGKIEPGEKTVIPGNPESQPFQSLESKTAIPFSQTIRTDAEKFIGENLINKIGIVITVIGVAIGAKYSIDHELISPLARIILGYLSGLGLLGIGIRLKKNYKNYSAVLVSGSVAIFYFITYSAYTFYNLIPQSLSFVMMALFTLFGVVTAFAYDLQVIAHIGLVGAYAVPFLVGGNSGNATVFFSYIALINFGVLAISLRKYWKALYYSCFSVTWLIFLFWLVHKYKVADHYGLSLLFISVFFVTFYLIFLDYKLRRREKFDTGDILLLIFNSFLFYGIGYFILKSRESGAQLVGLFTLLNAVVHFIVGWIINKQKLVDRNLFFFIAGLVLVFVTIAVPIQLNGNWVTLLWAGEAVLLFWIGRAKKVWIYERLSYPLILLAFFSLIHDWMHLYYEYNPEVPGSVRLIPLWNVQFMTSILFSGCFGLINYIHQRNPFTTRASGQKEIKSFIDFILPAVLLVTLYFTFLMEIANYWNQYFKDSLIKDKNGNPVWDLDLNLLKYIWMLNYTSFFLAMLMLINNRKIRSAMLGKILLGLGAFAVFIFLTRELLVLSELRESYLAGELNKFYQHNAGHILIRYVIYLFSGFLFYSLYRSIKQDFLNNPDLNLKILFEIGLAVSVVWVLSSEWINIMDVLRFTESYRLGLSILWGISALVLVIIGIWKRKKHLRIAAIGLFAITLMKLFFYDLTHLDTIAKTIVFVSLGILLLIISFLYNKYRHLIYSEV